MGPCEMPLIEFIVAEQDYEEDGVGEEDYYGGESDLVDVAMDEGCTAACQDILGRNSAGVIVVLNHSYVSIFIDLRFCCKSSRFRQRRCCGTGFMNLKASIQN